MSLKKLAFNDMIGKGFDSSVQESYCWQQFYENGASTDHESNQFWWVPIVWELHGHAANWDEHTRRPDGKFLRFPESKGKPTAVIVPKLLRLATLLTNKEEAEKLIDLVGDFCNGRIDIEE